MDPAILNSGLRSGEDQNFLHKQNSQAQGQSHIVSLNGRTENLVTIGISDVLCHSEIFTEQNSPTMSNRNAEDNTNAATQPDVIAKKTRQQKEMTFQDMYNQEVEYDDADEDDDSDWEPLEKTVPTMKWFCINCTMMNFDDVVHCDVCGEHKESEIIRHENSTSHLTGGVHTQGISDVIDGCEESFMRESALKSCCTAVGFDERMLLHSENEMKSQPHPERPDRLRAIAASLAIAGIFPGRCIPIPAREITQEELVMVHSLEHVEAVELTSCMLSSYFTPDTYANEHSACAARIAAGLCADLSKTIMSGQAKNGFALVRPPGHHAGVRQAMGFCLHNNAAVAAFAAQSANAKKVLIIDWDVHHGNGTQEIFVGSKSVLYISLHRHDGGRFYPGTGAADEVGTTDAEGYCVNVPWKRGGVGDNDYIFAFQYIVLPIALDFGPDLTIISAGFDAARGDPLGCCDVTPAGYAQMTHMLTNLSDGKLLVILEGGYNLRSISSSATAVINVLLGETPDYDVDGVVPSKAGLLTVLEVMKIHMKYWPNLESSFMKLQSQWASFSFQSKKHAERPTKRRRRLLVPTWWRWGRKRLMYKLLYRSLKSKGHRKKFR